MRNRSSYLFFSLKILFPVLIVSNILINPFIISAEETYVFERLWPTLQQPWYFGPVPNVAVDKEGNVYLADAYNHSIQKLNRDGILIMKWGRQGPGNGEFSSIGGIAINAMGEVYVADIGNHRIQKFTSNGVFLCKWGEMGAGEGQFNFTRGGRAECAAHLCVDSEGNVYVSDGSNHRIQKFSSDGLFITKWGNYGSEEGNFLWPTGITADINGDIYVADCNNNRIQKFSADGVFISKLADGQVSSPQDISMDSNGNIYVMVNLNYTSDRCIKKYTSEGILLTQWGAYGPENGNFKSPCGIEVSSSGEVYASEYQYNVLARSKIQKFSPEGLFINKWGSAGFNDGQFSWPIEITQDINGNLYVTDSGNGRIQKFTEDGLFITKWGSPGSGAGQFKDPAGIAVDNNGYVYVAERYNHRIQKFTSDGLFIKQWGTFGSSQGQFRYPEGIALDNSGNLYVTDWLNHRIQKFDTEGNFIAEWGEYGSENGQLIYPDSIAVDSAGYVYVGEYGNKRVQKFTADGMFIGKWGTEGSNEGQFIQINSIAINSNGNVYVADLPNDHIQVFTSDGIFITKIGSFGNLPGQFNRPAGLFVGNSDKLYVVDSGNNRIQIFTKIISENFKAIIVAGGGPFPGNNLWDATQLCANFAYRTLTYQGFTKETIHYLTSDTDLDLDDNGELDDVDGVPTNQNLQEAVTSWASDTDNLVVYLVDHGGDGTFRMSGTEILDASDLDAWLDQLQQAMSGKVMLVYDACESGSFISQLTPPSGKERIVITSTSPDEQAYFVTQGSVSFSNYFWTHIFNGVNVKDAFDLSSSALSTATDYQHPLLDANGNTITNETEDYTLTQNLFIGNGTIIHGDSPVIGFFSDPQTIIATNSAPLFADEVTDNDGITRVWAVIRPPDYTQGNSTNPVNDLPSVDLLPVGGNRFEAIYDGFNIEGTYHLAIYARDRIGNTSIPVLTTVSVNNPLRRRAIIAIGGDQSKPIWPAMENLGTQAYESLMFQGYTDDDIYFMSPVTFSAGVDGSTSLSNLNYAVNTWSISNTQDVVIFMIGEGGSGTFKLNSTETLTAETLDSWLDDLQNNISCTVTMIYDAPQSGSFLPQLIPPIDKKRILISSTTSDGAAHFLFEGDISFSKFFWRKVLDGMNVRDAFINARNAIGFSQNQVPQIDDSSNGIGNEKIDGNAARFYTLGTGIMLAGDDPLIGSISPEQTLVGETSATIWARDVTTTRTIDKVWAVITPPNVNISDPSSPVIDLPILTLLLAEDGKYEAIYNYFDIAGVYNIAIYAMDTDGNISTPKETKVIQIAGITKGDINFDGNIDLVDAVLVLKMVCGISSIQRIYNYADVNADWKIGLEEAVYIMQSVSGLR